MLSASEVGFSYVNRPSAGVAPASRSFLDQVEVVELSLADIQCLASFEPTGGVYHRLLESLQSVDQKGCTYPVLVGGH
jgi:hypothetical protein